MLEQRQQKCRAAGVANQYGLRVEVVCLEHYRQELCDRLEVESGIVRALYPVSAIRQLPVEPRVPRHVGVSTGAVKDNRALCHHPTVTSTAPAAEAHLH